MLYGAVKDHFGHYYKLHLPTDGRIADGLHGRQFNDPVFTKLFIRSLQARESHWRYLITRLAAHISPHISIEEAICQLLISERIKVFDVTDYVKCLDGSTGAAFKGNGNTHVRVLPASAQLMLNSKIRRFENAEEARAYLSQLEAPQDQLHSLAQENKLIEAGSGKPAVDVLLDKLAQAIVSGKLIIIETKPNNAPGKKSGEEFLEVHDRLPGNRRPTLGPHVGSSSYKVEPKAVVAASPTAIGKSAGTEDVPSTALSYQASSGVALKTEPGTTTTILGSYSKDMASIIDELGNVKSMNFSPKPGEFNVLNAPDELFNTLGPKGFWDEVNVPFLNSAAIRDDNILMATKPAFDVVDSKGMSVLVRPNPTTGKMELAGFGKEYLTLRKQGFVYRDGKMVKQ